MEPQLHQHQRQQSNTTSLPHCSFPWQLPSFLPFCKAASSSLKPCQEIQDWHNMSLTCHITGTQSQVYFPQLQFWKPFQGRLSVARPPGSSERSRWMSRDSSQRSEAVGTPKHAGTLSKRFLHERAHLQFFLESMPAFSSVGFPQLAFLKSWVRLQEQKEISKLHETSPHLEQNGVCMMLISEWVLLVIYCLFGLHSKSRCQSYLEESHSWS